MIPDPLRALLACPRCHGELRGSPDGTGLDCEACALRYPVRDGIPVMLVEQATPLDRAVVS